MINLVADNSWSGSDELDRIAILYENDAWLSDLFEALAARDVPFTAIRMDDAAVLLERPPSFGVVFNRVSPSSYLRGHGPAITCASSLMKILEAHGHRVINGSMSFSVETSKIAQLLLLRRLGMTTPATIMFNSVGRIGALARGFPFPALLKPDCGGSGAYIRRARSYEHLMSLLGTERDLFGPNHLLLLQAEFACGDKTIVRTEFIDGELVYAMRVRPRNTFNLCPAECCHRQAADPSSSEEPSVQFEAYPDIPAAAVAEARRIVKAARLDVGGVEYAELEDGTRSFYDINATSVYRPEIGARVGVDASGMLAAFLQRELVAHTARRSVRRTHSVPLR